MKEIGFRWNPLFGTIEEQANEQGLTLGKEASNINGYQDCLFGMHMDKIITDSIYDNILQRLHKYAVKHLKPLKQD